MPAGRPTKYSKMFSEQAYQLSLLGLTDVQMANVFGIDDSTFYRWKTEHEEFCEAITRGKDIADAKVASALYNRAVGMVVREQISTMKGLVWAEKELPPDTAAAKHWLGNRQRALWGSNGTTTVESENPLVIVAKPQ